MRLIAERRCGELLAATERNKGATVRGRMAVARYDPHTPTLADMGTSRQQAHRYQALAAAKLATLARGANQHSPIGESKSQSEAAALLNVGKRRLNESQRAMAAAKLANLARGANQHAQICAPSQSDAADMLNVSRRTVQAAREVTDHGAPASFLLAQIRPFHSP